MKKLIMVSAVFSTLLLGACVFAPGDSSPYEHTPRLVQPTVGQELLDLDRARDAGIINQAEFERAKDRILDKRG